MSRRDNIAKDERKKALKAKKLERKQKNREELKRLIIACEGEVTEKNYFQDFFDELISDHQISKTSLVIAKHKHTNPTGVLKDLLKELEKDDEFEYKWIVIDRDEERVGGGGHTKEDFNNAIIQANAKKIKIAYSNPSLEIWFLLHLEYRNTAIDRDEVVRKLKDTIEYEKNKDGIYKLLKSSQDFAISNAQRLLLSHQSQNREHLPSEDNPSTTIHKLVNTLNSLRD